MVAIDAKVIYRFAVSLRSKRSRTERTKFGPREGVFALVPREKWGESKTVEGRGWGRGEKVTLARKPLDFEKPVRPRTGLLIGAAWSS